MSSIAASELPHSELSLTNSGFRPWMLISPLLFVVLRSIYAGASELSGDEAYYWVWSRHLANGYFDHPPMVAWLIRASTSIFGHTEFAVRLPGILLISLGMLSATISGVRLGFGTRQILLLQIALFCFPMLHVSGAIITPDTPAIAFILFATTTAIVAYQTQTWWSYLLTGLLCGLAMLSKYTALIPCCGILLILFYNRPSSFFKVVAAGLLSCAVVLPMLWWNAQHGWVSIAFQLNHGTQNDGRPILQKLGEYVASQLLVATPILAILLVALAIRATVSRTPAKLLIAVPSLLTLITFTLTASRHKVEANWPALIWPPLLLLLPAFYASPHFWKRRLVHAGLVVAAVASLALMLTPVALARLAPNSPISQIGGWYDLSRQLQKEAGALPIIAGRYQDASLLAFYLPGRPHVPVLRTAHDRPSHFDLLATELPDGFFYVDGHTPVTNPWEAIAGNYRYTVSSDPPGHLAVTLDPVQSRGRYFTVCHIRSRDAAPTNR